MAKGFPQPSPEQREAQRLAHLTCDRAFQDFCDGCGVHFRPSPFNAPGACSQCCIRWGVYAERCES
jgi:hypothetical protein